MNYFWIFLVSEWWWSSSFWGLYIFEIVSKMNFTDFDENLIFIKSKFPILIGSKICLIVDKMKLKTWLFSATTLKASLLRFSDLKFSSCVKRSLWELKSRCELNSDLKNWKTLTVIPSSHSHDMRFMSSVQSFFSKSSICFKRKYNFSETFKRNPPRDTRLVLLSLFFLLLISSQVWNITLSRDSIIVLFWLKVLVSL